MITDLRGGDGDDGGEPPEGGGEASGGTVEAVEVVVNEVINVVGYRDRTDTRYRPG